MIENFVSEKKIDICHFHYGTDCGVFYPLLKKLYIPSVVSFYGYDAFSFPKKYFGYGKKYLKERVFSKVDCILAMTQEMKKDLIEAGCDEDKILIHYHGVPCEIFNCIKQNYNQQNDYFTLLDICSFDPVKGHIFIFKALKYLIEKGYDKIKLKIAGYGYYEKELKKFINSNNLSKYVIFLGYFKYGSPQMIYEIKHSDAFIHPSVITKDDKEGIPGAIVEAMIAGLPVISTYHGGIPYVIENEKTGLLVKEWDVKGLAEAIERLVNDIELRRRLGQNAQKYALENLDLIEKEKELESIYDGLLNKYN